MEESSEEYYRQLETELRQAQEERRDLAKAQLGMYESNPEDNLVKWQLNLEEEKDRIFHLLKAHRKVVNEKGEEMWAEPLDSNSAILNDYGVDYIMGLLESFLNRNIILSNFDLKRINQMCLDLSNQVIEDIYNDYEKMGLDTDEKRKKYPILVFKIIYNVEAALRRAMDNGERRSLRAIMTITQNETPMRMQNFPVTGQVPRRRLLHPTTW